MKLLEYVKILEGQSRGARMEAIKDLLTTLQVPFQTHEYESGTNIIVSSGQPLSLGIGSHFDAVPGSPGANDNASAVAVCLGVLSGLSGRRPVHFGVNFYFFDEEETGLKGSAAYVKQFGINHLVGLINLEMCGFGDRIALWPLSEESAGKVLLTLEEQAENERIFVKRFDKIVTNYADHLSFRKAGLSDAFSVTCISAKELEVAYHYYQALQAGADQAILAGIMSRAPLFEHYHQPTDRSI